MMVRRWSSTSNQSVKFSADPMNPWQSSSGGAGSAGQVAQALAFVCRETFFEPVHGRGHSVSICARWRRPL